MFLFRPVVVQTKKTDTRNPLHPKCKSPLITTTIRWLLPFILLTWEKHKLRAINAGPGGAVNLLKKCYTNAVMFVGGDRIGAFDWLGT